MLVYGLCCLRWSCCGLCFLVWLCKFVCLWFRVYFVPVGVFVGLGDYYCCELGGGCFRLCLLVCIVVVGLFGFGVGRYWLTGCCVFSALFSCFWCLLLIIWLLFNGTD